jgi:hypothetical protein
MKKIVPGNSRGMLASVAATVFVFTGPGFLGYSLFAGGSEGHEDL